jgi:hypothetical protein
LHIIRNDIPRLSFKQNGNDQASSSSLQKPV